MITPEMLNLKRMRVLCGLRQIEVWAGTGITPGRISRAENGRLELNETEMRSLRLYLQEQWNMVQARDVRLYAGIGMVKAATSQTVC